ncbi:uncharacterized protein LOC141660340 [Apium graveolens]|uniref:uncharacterized protein LOC141660340 n=1 Tax=Apium graveolens TaxID=4045 RepID=UPI003D7BFB23
MPPDPHNFGAKNEMANNLKSQFSQTPSMRALRCKFTRIVSNHDQLKIAFHQLKSQIESGLNEAEDVFRSLAIPLSKLVGLKTVEMAEEGRYSNFFMTSDARTQNRWENSGRTNSPEGSPSATDRVHQAHKFEEDFTTRATIARKDLVQKQKNQLTQLVYLLRKIETQVNSSQNKVSQNIGDHQVSMRKYFEKAMRYISTFYQSGQNYEAFLVTVQILRATFSRVHNVLGSVEGDVDDLMHKLATLMCNPMMEYVKGMKAEITSGTLPRLLTVVEEMVEENKDRRLELEEARMKVKGAEEWKIEALSRLEESEARARKMQLQLGLLLESEKRPLNSERNTGQEFICFREDQTKDEKLLWELLKKKRKYQPPDSPFAQTGSLCTGTNNKHQKLTRGRSSVHCKPITRSCVQGLNPQTPRLDYLIPLGSTPSATTHKYFMRKRITP